MNDQVKKPAATTAEQEDTTMGGPATAPSENLIDIRTVSLMLWRGKWFVLCFVLIGTLYGARQMHNFPTVYEAEMTIFPMKSESGASSAGTGKAIAQALGVNVGTSSGFTTIDRLRILFGSHRFAQHLQQKLGMMQRLFAGSWDMENKRWRVPNGWRFEIDQKIKRFFNLSTWRQLDTHTLAQHLNGAIVMTPIRDTGIRRISYRNSNPDLALYILRTVYNEADDMLRADDQIIAVQRKEYIQGRLAIEPLEENQKVLLGMLAGVEQSLMFLDNDLPYAARVLEPPKVSSSPVYPQMTSVFAPPIIISLSLGVCLVLLVQLFRRE